MLNLKYQLKNILHWAYGVHFWEPEGIPYDPTLELGWNCAGARTVFCSFCHSRFTASPYLFMKVYWRKLSQEEREKYVVQEDTWGNYWFFRRKVI